MACDPTGQLLRDGNPLPPKSDPPHPQTMTHES